MYVFQPLSVITFLSSWCLLDIGSGQDPLPEVMDDRLRLELVAEEPVLRTPIGLAIDAEDRIYVLESHTHLTPPDYSGPKGDRVLRFEDGDGDGEFDVSEFANGLQQGMNMAISPEGVLHVACAREVVRLPDANADGKCDVIETLLKLETENTYPHSALLGITFDRDGWMYVSRGNNGSMAYAAIGTDGSRVVGYGDGGSILRCRSDGSQVGEHATGFWNPIQLKVDCYGRLICVDNDPDARGPNRIVHVVSGGDYGHRSMYGASGNHAFQGWNGELPGTLPFAGGTGEAPCDLLDTSRTTLPRKFAESLLVTVWNENSVEWHRRRRRGVSFETTGQVLIQGDKQFRPVAIDANSQGEIFFTDWVQVDYPNHGRGRLWRLTSKGASQSIVPQVRTAFDPPLESAGTARLREVAQLSPDKDFEQLCEAIVSEDHFLSHTAIEQFTGGPFRPQIEALTWHESSEYRLAGLLAATRYLGERTAWQMEILSRALSDPHPDVRYAAMIAVGTQRLVEVADKVELAIQLPGTNAKILDAYLAAKSCLQPDFVDAYEHRRYRSAKKIPRKIQPTWLLAIARDSQRPPALRALALSRISDPGDTAARQIATNWLASHQPAVLQQAAVQFLRGSPSSETLLLALARDPACAMSTRQAAIAALGSLPLPKDKRKSLAMQLVRLIECISEEPDPALSVEAARALQQFADLSAVQRAVAAWLSNLEQLPAKHLPIRESLFRIQGTPNPQRPQDLRSWQEAMSQAGNPLAGKFVFLSSRATCTQCHRLDGQGNTLGPNLSNLSQSASREQIVRSVLEPSEQFAPQYQAWTILTVEGQAVTGLQIDHLSDGGIEIIQSDGESVRFAAEEIADYRASRTSLMPAGLEQNLTVSEMRDLIAYLQSVSGL